MGDSTPAICPPGYTNTGLSCLRPADTQPNGGSAPADCPSGYTNTGLTCYRGPHTYSAPSTVANCPSGYTNTGLTCHRAYDTAECSSRNVIGACSTCPSGYYNAGYFCARDAHTLGLSSMSCPSGRFFSAGRCYVECPSGYTNIGEFCSRGASTLGESAFTCPVGTFYSTGRCYKPCPDGYTNTGVSCYRGPHTLGESAFSCLIGTEYLLGRCYQPCPSGYVNTTVSCYREPRIYDTSVMTCPEGRFMNTGRCYLPCPEGYTNTGVSCYREPYIYAMDSSSCTDGRTFTLGRCYLPCPEGYTNTGVSCFRPADTQGYSSMSCLADETLQDGRCYANVSASRNGSQARPFWMFASDAYTLEQAEIALKSGANALKPAITYLSGAQYPAGQILPDDLYVYPEDARVLSWPPLPLKDYLSGLHRLAIEFPALAQVVLDIKPSAATAEWGMPIQQAVRQYLLRQGETDEIGLSVIYSVGGRDAVEVFESILPNLGAREGVQVDAEDDPVLSNDYFLARGVEHIGYGDGVPGANLSGVGGNVLAAMDKFAWLRAGTGSPRTAHAWSITDPETMKEYITTGVDGLVSGDVGVLAAIVGGRSDVRPATRDDDPFKPANEAYALKVVTGDRANAGTDAGLTFTLTGCLGQTLGTVNASRITRMERGQTNYLAILSKDLGRLTTLKVSRDDSGAGQDWWLDSVEITSQRHLGSETFQAVFQNWVPTSGLTTSLSDESCQIALQGESPSLQQGARTQQVNLARVLHAQAGAELRAEQIPGQDSDGIDGLASLSLSTSGGQRNVSARLAASCDATLGEHPVDIRVYDAYSGAAANGSASLLVTANTPPRLGEYPDTQVTASGGTSVRPAQVPADNGRIASLTASAPGFTGKLTGNPATGSVLITQAGPEGEYAVSVVAKDNCGATSVQNFMLTVVATSNPKTGDVNGDGQVDSDDLAQVVAARNTAASGPDDLRDLNRDGRIDATDVRLLTNLCARPRCTKP